MKKATKKNKKLLKVVTAVTALGVVAAVSFSATFAYLTALSERKTNVFTSEGIDIEQTESNWNPKKDHIYQPGSEFDKNPKVTNTAESKANTFVATALSFFVEISQSDYNDASADRTANPKRYRVVDVDDNGKTVRKYYKRIGMSDFTSKYATLENLDSTNWDAAGVAIADSAIYYYCGKAGTGKLEELYPATETNKGKQTTETTELFTGVKFLSEGGAMGSATGPATVGGNSIPDVKIVVTSFAVKAASYADVPAAKTALENLIRGHINEVKLDGEVEV